MWAFASEVSSADAKSERLLYAFIYLLYDMKRVIQIQKVDVCLKLFSKNE